MAQGASTYVLLGFLQNSVNFLLLPLFASALTPSQYGRLGLLVTIGALTAVVASLGLDLAVFRGHFNLLDDVIQRNRQIGSLARFLIAYPLGLGLLGSVTVLLIGGQPMGIPSEVLAIGWLSPCLIVAATVAPLALLRAEQRFGDYAKLAIAQLLLQIGLKILFILILRKGILGWALADLIAGFLLIPVGLRLMRVPLRGQIDARHVRPALALTLPTLPHRIAHWGLSLSDRLVLVNLVTAATLGSYTVGYQIAAVVGLLLAQVNQAVGPFYGRAIEDPSAAAPLRILATSQALLTIYIGTGMALLGPLLVVLILPSAYAAAAAIIPMVALGQTFFALYFIPTNALGIIDGDTNWLWFPGVISAVANVSLNLWLVPQYGIMAAAVSTAATYMLLLGSALVLQAVRGRTRVPLMWKRLGSGMILLLGLYATAMNISTSSQLKDFALRVALLLLLGPVLVRVSGAGRLLRT